MTLKVLSVASECAPFVKTGGLADVVGALARALGPHDINCRVLLPCYRQMADVAKKAKVLLDVGEIYGGPVRVLGKVVQGIDLLLIDAPHLFDRPGEIYLNKSGKDWEDNHLRYGLLSQVAAQISVDGIGKWRPDVVHAHDWQAALTPVYQDQLGGKRVPCVLTIHNIAFQGIFPKRTRAALKLDPKGFSIDGYEYFGSISFLKGGLISADQITTVSPTYARELMTAEMGMGLEGVLAARRDVLSGILNGIDLDDWDPETDPYLAKNYDSRSIKKKSANRRALIDRFGLDPEVKGPLFSVVSRLTSQKGLDLVLETLPAALEKGATLVLLGSGSPELEASFRQLAKDYPSQVGVEIGFDEGLAHLIQAGSDATLVPSRFEPCGLTQLYALRYGTLPVVSRTGGLADTVIDANDAALKKDCATGVQFSPITAEKLSDALDRVIQLYGDETLWRRIARNGMKHPVGWDASAKRIAALYEKLAS